MRQGIGANPHIEDVFQSENTCQGVFFALALRLYAERRWSFPFSCQYLRTRTFQVVQVLSGLKIFLTRERITTNTLHH
jgi:hypothetical protein